MKQRAYALGLKTKEVLIMAHRLKAATLVLFLATNVLLLGILGIDESLGAVAAGFTHTDSGGGVTMSVTYLHPQGVNETRFEVALDSDSIDLDAYDLKALSVVRDDTGKNYQAIRVDNKGGGHHREITVVFPKVSPLAKRLELVIRNVGRIKTRSFFWDLQ
jgi:hypothetical protein